MEMKTKKHSIGETIAKLRRQKGWTQISLAKKLQVSDKAVSKWEKDNGTPSIEFFPVLAELFGVSIDYIMTGEEPRKEIITMSKLELCAQKDDVSLVGNFTADTRDESGRSLRDYVFKYKSYQVLRKLLIRCESAEAFANVVGQKLSYRPTKEEFANVLYYAILTDTVSKMKALINKRRSEAYDVFQAYLDLMTSKELETEDFSRIFDLLVKQPKLLRNSHDILFAKWEKQNYYDHGRFGKSLWALGISELMDHAVKCRETGVFDKYFIYLKNINEESIVYVDAVKKQRESQIPNFYGVTPFMDEKLKHPYITFKLSTLKFLLNNGDVEKAQEADKFNSLYDGVCLDTDELRVAKLKQNKSVSAEELMVQRAIHNGILYIDELLAVKNVKIIKKALNDYPIHTVEKLLKFYDNEQWRDLFQWSVDNKNFVLSDAVINKEIESVEEEIIKYAKAKTADFIVNREHIKVVERNEINGKIIEHTVHLDQKGTKNDLIEFFKICKTQILENITLSIEKEKTIAELSKEYFEKELTKGNTEIVVIKLCVRLESVFKCNYRYEGDFADMITRYCKEKLHWQEDNGWGDMTEYIDERAIKLLHKLRKQRNSIVHSEKDYEPMTIAEIKECIDLICAIK